MQKKISRRGFLKAASISAASAAALLATGCSANSAASAAPDTAPAASDSTAAETKSGAPKYIFLFIGDGCGQTQIQIANYYQGTVANDGAVVSQPLPFLSFPCVGTVTTYDASSFCPDSASTATSIATGHKTLSGVINMDPETQTEAYETISEKLHSQLGYKVGVISTVNMNHATPAAFYAHQASRGNYYAIGEELCSSGFEYFAGGAFLAPTGENEDQTDLLERAAEAGYQVVTTQKDAEALAAGAGNTLIIAEKTADGDAMNYSMDATDGEWQLTDYVNKGIELLDGDAGFFMMAESGKIDWACHANDAAASIHDVIELGNAVQAAYAFYEQHKDETLILVTADHETGGLTIGYATTNYDTFLYNLQQQTMSYAKFDTEYVAKYQADKTAFADAMQDVKACFGLLLPDDPDATEDNTLVLTDWEAENLEYAYNRTLETGSASQDEMTQADYEKFGTYQPFSMEICHLIAHKSGVSHTTYAHTGAPVALYAIGCGAEQFVGNYDNTEIYNKLAALTGVQ